MSAIGKEILVILLMLGVNETFYYQLAIFMVTYAFLYFVVFKPYLRMFQERERRTIGNKNLAGKIAEEVQEMELDYQAKARKLSAKYKDVYDRHRLEAVSESNKLVEEARLQSKQTLEKAKKDIQESLSSIKKDLSSEAPHISKVIVKQVLGREMS